MTLPMLAKEDALPLFHQAMRDEFQKGGSYGAFLLTLLGLAGLVFAVFIIQKWYDQSRQVKEQFSNPMKLFSNLLEKLRLSPESQQLLTSVARDCEIENPTALLISSQLFDRHTSNWSDGNSSNDPSEKLALIRERLFGK